MIDEISMLPPLLFDTTHYRLCEATAPRGALVETDTPFGDVQHVVVSGDFGGQIEPVCAPYLHEVMATGAKMCTATGDQGRLAESTGIPNHP